MRVHKAKAFSTMLFAAALFSGGASAMLPDSGWYYNAAEPGRGFNIEIQDDTLFMAGFLYDTQGKPIWVVSSGPMAGDAVYSGAAFQTANGQPLGDRDQDEVEDRRDRDRGVHNEHDGEYHREWLQLHGGARTVRLRFYEPGAAALGRVCVRVGRPEPGNLVW